MPGIAAEHVVGEERYTHHVADFLCYIDVEAEVGTVALLYFQRMSHVGFKQMVEPGVLYILHGVEEALFEEYGLGVLQGQVSDGNCVVAVFTPVGIFPYGLGSECHYETYARDVVGDAQCC